MKNKMTVKEFRDLGYLQELNRTFLHPLGLALEVIVEENGDMQFGEVWDSRKDPEGIIFAWEQFDMDEVRKKAHCVVDEMVKRYSKREESLGYIIQPIPEK